MTQDPYETTLLSKGGQDAPLMNTNTHHLHTQPSAAPNSDATMHNLLISRISVVT